MTSFAKLFRAPRRRVTKQEYLEKIQDSWRKTRSLSEKAVWLFRRHNAITSRYPDWTLKDTTTLLSITDAEIATLIAAAKAICEQAIPIKTHDSSIRAIAKFKQIVEVATGACPTPSRITHHVHFLCPYILWRKFRAHFPGHGEIQERIVEAMTMYLKVIEKVEKEG